MSGEILIMLVGCSFILIGIVVYRYMISIDNDFKKDCEEISDEEYDELTEMVKNNKTFKTFVYKESPLKVARWQYEIYKKDFPIVLAEQPSLSKQKFRDAVNE